MIALIFVGFIFQACRDTKMKKEKKIIRFFSERKGGITSCPIDSEKVKELHTCPYRIDINGDYASLCDCGAEGTSNCAEDI